MVYVTYVALLLSITLADTISPDKLNYLSFPSNTFAKVQLLNKLLILETTIYESSSFNIVKKSSRSTFIHLQEVKVF